MRSLWRVVGKDVWLWELSLVAWGLLASYLMTAHGHLDWTGHALGRDFVNYWTAGHLVAEGRIADIFNPGIFLGHEHRLFDPRLPFHFWSYPPPALFLVAPLALTAYMPGLFLWSLAGLVALYPALRAWTALGPTPTLWLWLILLCPAVATNIALGQNGAFTAALLIGGIALIEKRPTWAGVLFGLLIFKPQIGLLIPVAVLAGRHWKVFLAAAIAGCLLLALSALVYGLDAWKGFLGPTLHMQTLMLRQGRGPFQWMMPSAFMAARGLGIQWTWAMAIQAPFTLAAIATVWITWARREVSFQLKGAVLMMATFVASPQAFNYDLVPAAAAALLLWRRDKVVGQGLAVAVWALPVLMIALQAVHIVVTPIVLTWAMVELARQARGTAEPLTLPSPQRGEGSPAIR